MNNLAVNLARILRDRRLTLAKLSALSKVPKATIHGWTVGKSPNIDQLKRVAVALEVSVHRLAWGFSDPHESLGDDVLKELFSGDVRVTVHRIERKRL